MGLPPKHVKSPDAKPSDGRSPLPGTKIFALGVSLFCTGMIWSFLIPEAEAKVAFHYVLWLALGMGATGLVMNIFHFFTNGKKMPSPSMVVSQIPGSPNKDSQPSTISNSAAQKTWPGTKVIGLAAFVFCVGLVWPPLAPGTGGEESFQKIISLAIYVACAGMVINLLYYFLRERKTSGDLKTWPGTILIGISLLLGQIGFLSFMFVETERSPIDNALFFVFGIAALLMPVGLIVNGVYAVAVKKHAFRKTSLWFFVYLAWVFTNQHYSFLEGLESYVLMYAGASLVTHFVLMIKNRFWNKPQQTQLA